MALPLHLRMTMHNVDIWAKWAERGKWTSHSTCRIVTFPITSTTLGFASYLAYPRAAYGQGVPWGEARDKAGDEGLEGWMGCTDVDGKVGKEWHGVSDKG
jgi:hypothetical protein